MEQKLRSAGRPRGFDEAIARDAIRDVFWTRGFAATSLEDLSAATGLHKPSLYGAFGDKRAMFDDSFKTYLRTMGEVLTASLSQPQLRDALAAHFQSISTIFFGKKAGRGCFMASAVAPLAASDPVIAERVRRVMANLSGAFLERVRRAQTDGDLSPAFDVQTAADLLVGTHLRLGMMARSGEEEATLRAVWQRVVNSLAPEL